MSDKEVPSTSTCVKKNPKGKPVRSGQKRMAYNIYINHKNKGLCKSEAVDRTSAETGIGKTLMYIIVSEMESTGIVKSPPKKRVCKNVYTKLSEDERKAVRHAVHSFFKRNEMPNLNKIFQAINENEFIRPISRTSLFRVLKELGFVWEKRARNSIIVERDDIILWRRRYLRKIRQYREEGRVIYYLDETWVNAGHTRTKVWKDKTVTNRRQAFVEDLSLGLKDPCGKSNRIIITHIGNENGFVEGGLLLMQSKKTGDFHEDMNSNVFEEWMEKTLPLLSENCVIIMDNAPYHSVKMEKTPTAAWKKDDIIKYLQEKGQQVDEHFLKVELLAMVKDHIQRYPVPYKIDDIVRKSNREVLRLPPYHCKLNAIELIWSEVKGFVAANNKTFKSSDVINLFREGLAQVTPEAWSNCIRHVIKEEEELYQLDNIVENMQMQFVVNTGSSSETETDSE